MHAAELYMIEAVLCCARARVCYVWWNAGLWVLSDLHERSRRRRWSLIFPSAALRIAIKFDDFLFFFFSSTPPPRACAFEKNIIG